MNYIVQEDSLESLGLQGDGLQPAHPKETSPEYSLEGMMLKLRLQYFHTNSLEKTLMLGKIEGRRSG